MHIPNELKKYKQWLVWKYESVGGRLTKIPYDVNTGHKASSTNPDTWVYLAQAYAVVHKYDGLGFVFTKNDDLIGIDWDKVDLMDIIDEVKSFESYAELSPSGNGVHCICRGVLPAGARCRNGNREIYTHGRFFTFTGNHISGTPDNVMHAPQDVLDGFITKITPMQSSATSPRSSNQILPHVAKPTCSENILDVITAIKCSKYFNRFKELYNGKMDGYHSQSEADLMLCYIIARHTNNPSDIDVIFRKSKLYRPKWENCYYRTRTINMAMTNALIRDLEEVVEND
jgi:putative DNA primase/helicase